MRLSAYSELMRGVPVGLEEGELLARWRTGDRAAGQELFRRSYKVVSRYLRNKVSGSVHGDLVQKTFLACLNSSMQFRGESSFRTYLLGIAHHTLVDHFRAAGRAAAREHDGERGPELDDLIVAETFAEPDAIVSRRQEHRILLAALRRLPFPLQVALELHYWESLKVREIAEVLRAPRGTVKTRLRDGRLRLRRELARGRFALDLLQSTMDTLDRWSAGVQRGRGALDDE